MLRVKQPIPTLILMGLTLLVGCGETQRDNGTAQQSASIERNVPESTISLTPIINNTPITSPTRSPLPDMLSTREAIEVSREETRVALATAAALTPTVPQPTYPPPTTPEPRPTGIIDPNLGAHYCDCRFENGWLGHVNDHDILAYAGAFYWPMESWDKPSNHGVILVFHHDLGVNWFLIPIDAGSVHVVSVNGAQLTLLSTNGTQFIFDAGTENWIEPPVTPTVVPSTATVSP